MKSWEGFPNKDSLPLKRPQPLGLQLLFFLFLFRLDLGDLFLWNFFCEVFNYLRVHFKMNATPGNSEEWIINNGGLEKITVLTYGDLLASMLNFGFVIFEVLEVAI